MEGPDYKWKIQTIFEGHFIPGKSRRNYTIACDRLRVCEKMKKTSKECDLSLMSKAENGTMIDNNPTFDILEDFDESEFFNP